MWMKQQEENMHVKSESDKYIQEEEHMHGSYVNHLFVKKRIKYILHAGLCVRGGTDIIFLTTSLAFLSAPLFKRRFMQS